MMEVSSKQLTKVMLFLETSSRWEWHASILVVINSEIAEEIGNCLRKETSVEKHLCSSKEDNPCEVNGGLWRGNAQVSL